MVSCIVPTYNREDMLTNSICMFNKQTYANREMVIVDDSSPRMSFKIMKIIHNNPKIKYIYLPERKSIGCKRNIAMEASDGQYIAFWDDDDIHGRNRLLNQVQRMRHTRCDLTTNGRHIYYESDTFKWYSLFSRPDLQKQLWWKRMLMPSLMFKHSLTRYAAFPNRYISEDREFVRKLLNKYPRLKIDIWDDAPIGDFAYVLHRNNTAWTKLATQIISVTKPINVKRKK